MRIYGVVYHSECFTYDIALIQSYLYSMLEIAVSDAGIDVLALIAVLMFPRYEFPHTLSYRHSEDITQIGIRYSEK